MRRKKSLPVPENETSEILTHLKKLDLSQKQKIIKVIDRIKNEPQKEDKPKKEDKKEDKNNP